MKNILDRETTRVIEEALDELSEFHQNVLRCRFFYRLTLEATGKLYGITRERIRQAEAKALRTLRHPDVLKKLEEICSWDH